MTTALNNVPLKPLNAVSLDPLNTVLLNPLDPPNPSLTGLVSLPAVHHPAVPAVRSAYRPEVREGHGSVVVCWGGGRQAAGVGGVRGLAGRGGVICQSENSLCESHVSLLGTEYKYIPFPS